MKTADCVFYTLNPHITIVFFGHCKGQCHLQYEFVLSKSACSEEEL